jgi:hypothetical protein
MKKCKKCLQEKPETEFYTTKYKDKTYLLNECKSCTLARTNENYYSDHKRQKAIRKQNTAKRRAANKDKLISYLLEHPCVDCGESDLVVLEFDHVRKKSFNISDAFMKSWDAILKEISKCEVVCANCHKRRTATRAGDWYKSK